jgi:hypothetical protein
MATSKTPVPAAPSAGITSSSIADAGAGLTRVIVSAITVPVTIATSLGNSLVRAFSSLASSLDGATASPGSNEVVKAAGDLVNATTGLYVSVLKAALGGIESATRAVNSAVNEAIEPTRK